MNTHYSLVAAAFAAFTIGSQPFAVASSAAAPAASLSKEELNREEIMAAELKSLKEELTKVIPVIDETKKSTLIAARAAIKQAKADLVAAQQPIDKIAGAAGLVGHRKNKWIAEANKAIAAAEAALKKATTDAEREAAQKDLAHWQDNLKQGQAALVDAEAALVAAKANEAQYKQALEAAKTTLDQANAAEAQAATAIQSAVGSFMNSDALDSKLVAYMVRAQATPKGLREFAAQGGKQAELLEGLLKDKALMQAMLEAGGAKEGRYGQAMEIFSTIQQASPKSKDGIFKRLALATSLEHAKPIPQTNPLAATDAPKFVDPLKRYQHFEKAFLAGELDPAFKDLSTWELRSVINGDETEEVLSWGREMLRNYRPDHVLNPDYGWRYSGSVTSEVKYGSQNVKDDLPTLHPFQNMIMNGGICGRRAFFGRFILRAFGIPTAPRPQRGHAALVHWTPKGWVINLGAGWGNRDSKGILGYTDADFLTETQSRQNPDEYRKALRAEWAGHVIGEPEYISMKPESGGVWSTIANNHKRAIVAAAKPTELAALGTNLGEANQSAEERARAVVKATVTEDDKKVSVDSAGAITIPAAAFTGAQVLGSFSGGHQLFSGSGVFRVDFDAPAAGTYALTAPFVTVHKNPNLQLTLNDSSKALEIPIPYTMGKWEDTTPVQVSLVQGKNTLSFARPEGSRGLAIKEITLKPVK